MDGEPFIVSTRVNGICYAKTLIDSGCLAYGTISQRFAQKWRLERIPITPRPLTELMSTTKSAISEVAYMDIDLDGHQQRRIFLYVIPNQKDYDIVLGHPWMSSQNVVLAPGRAELKITAPILAQFDPEKETVLEADSSGWSIGGVLSQYDKKGELHPCAYFS